MRKIFGLILLSPLLILLLSGCGHMRGSEKEDSSPAPAVEEKPKYIYHRVYAGETMATIAKWYTGKESDWRMIAEENPDLSATKLKKGDIVRIPTSLATLHTEQPNHSTATKKRKTTTKKTSKPTAAPEGSTSQPEAAEELPDAVFGPK